MIDLLITVLCITVVIKRIDFYSLKNAQTNRECLFQRFYVTTAAVFSQKEITLPQERNKNCLRLFSDLKTERVQKMYAFRGFRDF